MMERDEILEKIRTDKQYAVDMHKLLWNWLAENPGKAKNDWPAWEFNTGNVPSVENYCFLCEYAVSGEYKGCGSGGIHCLLSWPSSNGCIGDKGDETALWSSFEDLTRKKKHQQAAPIAAQIRDLPVK